MIGLYKSNKQSIISFHIRLFEKKLCDKRCGSRITDICITMGPK